MENMKKFISWRRVSTKKQGRSGLGLEAQKTMIDYFIQAEKGELVADYPEVYTGTDLQGCTELKKAIEHCKKENAILIIAKTDRFRNTIEALQVYESMGDGKIYFCDLPHTDKFTLTLFFALAEREALLVSIRTKAALDAKRARGETWVRNLDTSAASKQSALNRRLTAQENESNQRVWRYLQSWESRNKRLTPNTPKEVFEELATILNELGYTTPRGLEFTGLRLRAMWTKLRDLYVYSK